MAVFDFADSVDRARVNDALAAMRERGCDLQFAPMMEARRDFSRLMRELGTTQLVLRSRGRVKGALLARAGWLGLHETIEDLHDQIAVVRWGIDGVPAIPLVNLMPHARRLAFEAWREANSVTEPYLRVYHVQVAAGVVARLDDEAPLVHRSLMGDLARLSRTPKPGPQQAVGRAPPAAWRMRAYGRRIVWRVDDEVVTVVRLVRG